MKRGVEKLFRSIAMKFKNRPGSQKSTPQTSSNKKVSDDTGLEKRFDTTMIKKNEFAFIIAGALLVTLLVFLIFFRSGTSKTDQATSELSSGALGDFESRISVLEKSVQNMTDSGTVAGSPDGKGALPADLLDQRLTRLETAFSVKFDSVIDRIAGIEKTISSLKTTAQTAAPKSIVSVPTPEPSKRTAPPVKKAAKKTDLFHAVKKGETLYSISKQYNTTVQELRKLNNLEPDADIYPGNNLLIR